MGHPINNSRSDWWYGGIAVRLYGGLNAVNYSGCIT